VQRVLSPGLGPATRVALRPSNAATRRRWWGFGVPLLYLGLSIVFIGRWALLARWPGTIGTGPDVQIFLWGLRWWPYALLHGVNPLVSHQVWAPYGGGVMWTTTVPLLSVLFSPITLGFGPAVSWNLLCVLAPALAAWAAYLLCLELCQAQAAAVVGGLLFGFSTYEMAETSAHLHVAMTALIPLAGLLAARYARGRYGGAGVAWRLALLVLAQFLISPELCVTLLFMALITAVVAALLVPASRRPIRRALPWIGGGLAAAGVVAAPLLVHMLTTMPTGLLNQPSHYSIDLANFVVPTRLTALGGRAGASFSQHYIGNLAEESGYLGIPLLLAIGWGLIEGRRDRSIRLAGAVCGLAALISLGPRLHLDGLTTIWLPGALLTRAPGLKEAIPDRFMVYVALSAAILVSLWMARWPSRRRGWRWALVVLSLICLIPAPQRHLWWRPTPQFIVRDDLGRMIPRGDIVVWLPFWRVDDRALYAQAVAGMRFKLDDRWFQTLPREYDGVANSRALALTRQTHRTLRVLRRDLCALGADYAVVYNRKPGRARLLSGLGIRPERADSLLIYRLPAALCQPRRLAGISLPARDGAAAT
jgi:hypothetical protein